MKFCVFSRQPRSQGSHLPCRNLFGNLSYFEQLFAFWAISLGIFKFCDIGAALSAMWPFFHISQCFRYLATLLTRQNCTKNAVHFAYFVKKKKFLFLRATFEQLSLQKATFDCYLSNFWVTVSTWQSAKHLQMESVFQVFNLWKYYFWNLHKICFLMVVLLS